MSVGLDDAGDTSRGKQNRPASWLTLRAVGVVGAAQPDSGSSELPAAVAPFTPIPTPAMVSLSVAVVGMGKDHHRPMGRRHRTDHNYGWRSPDRGNRGTHLHRRVVNGAGDDNRRIEHYRTAKAYVDRNGSLGRSGDGGQCDCGEDQFRFHARFDCGPAETFDWRASEKLEAVLIGEGGGWWAGVAPPSGRVTQPMSRD